MFRKAILSVTLGTLALSAPVAANAGDLFVHANYALYDDLCQNPVFLGVYEGSLYTNTQARRLAALYQGYISGPIIQVVERAVDAVQGQISKCFVTYSETLFRDIDGDGSFSAGVDHAFARKYVCTASTGQAYAEVYFGQTDRDGNFTGNLMCAIAR